MQIVIDIDENLYTRLFDNGDTNAVDMLNACVAIRKGIPLQESKTGHWKKTTDCHCYWYRCSCCGTKAPKNEWGSDYFSPYCPECNAKMSEIPTGLEPQERSE